MSDFNVHDTLDKLEDWLLETAQTIRLCRRRLCSPATLDDPDATALLRLLETLAKQLLFRRPPNINWDEIQSAADSLKKLAEGRCNDDAS